MQQLLKPADYAQKHGLSRQSVYAKIKRGTLASRQIDGRYYVIVDDNEEPPKEESQDNSLESLESETNEIIKAKNETIKVLQQSIEDLKEMNRHMMKTLQDEVALLKQAFNEMKMLYGSQLLLEAKVQETQEDGGNTEIAEAEITSESEPEEPGEAMAEVNDIDANTETEESAEEPPSSDECWLPLGDLIQRNQYNYSKAKQIVKRFKRAYKKGDERIRKENGIYYISCYDFYEDILD